jgi:two-component system CheB/CheR fusion protein
MPPLCEPDASDAEAPTVVVVGASAGGLEAFSEFLKAVPKDTGVAFVLVQHLDPRHTSALVELLQPRTELPVLEVSDGTIVRPNQVYVTYDLGFWGKPDNRITGCTVDVSQEAKP